MKGSVDEVKARVIEIEDPSYDEIIKAERGGGNRKTLVDWLKKKRDKQIVIIETLGESVLVDADLRELEEGTEIGIRYRKTPPVFYGKFVVRCKKCIEEFEHPIHIPSMEQQILCPKCGEIHVAKITPVGGRYELEFPEHVEVVEKRRKKRK